ncbi:MAG: T9SS type A sorting domain-containing protein [Ignavibacteriaceae bacterium]
MKKTLLPLIVVLLFSFNNLFAQDTLYVSLNGSNTLPYSSTITAATSIQTAISAASPGDLILVENGNFNLAATINLTKGVTVKSLYGYEFAIIDGQNARLCIGINHADAVVDGFTIRNGYNPSSFGGGVNIISGGTVQNCLITNNQARDGGGVAIDNSGIVQNCIVRNNLASDNGSNGYGGGIRLLNGGTARGCLVYGNTSLNYGGGINIWNAGRIENCTITNNTAPNGAGVRCRNNSVMVNSISYFNTGLNWQTNGTGQSFSNNCTTPALPSGTGNITADPQFVNAGANDYRLLATSPAVDAGINSGWTGGATDLNGNPRLFNTTVDMGAFEYFNPPPTPLTPWPGIFSGDVLTTFTWNQVASSNAYTIQIATDDLFNNVVQTLSTGDVATYTLTTPLAWNTNYWWRIKGNATPYSSYLSFHTELVAPVPTQPTNNATGISIEPTLNWTDAGSFGTYSWMISTQIDFPDDPAKTYWNSSGNPPLTLPHSINPTFGGVFPDGFLKGNTTYYWKVKSFFPATLLYSKYTPVQTFTTTSAVLPVLSWPVGGAVVYTTPVGLYWYLNESSAGVTYDLLYSPNADMSVAITIPGLTTGEYTINAGLTPGTTYYWLVKAHKNGTLRNISAKESFRLTSEGHVPLVPILSWPTGNATLYTNTPTLYWYANGNSTGLSYELQCVPAADPWLPDNSFTSVVGMNTTTPPLQPGVEYAYRVRSVLGTQKSDWSVYQTFTIIATPVATPLVPILSWPTDNALLYTNTPTLYWYVDGDGTGLTYELQCVPAADPWPADNSFTSVVGMNTTTAPLQPGVQYAYRVRSVLGTEKSAWSVYETFSIISTSAGTPLIPILSWPTDNALLYTNTPTLYWYVDGDGTGLTYELQCVPAADPWPADNSFTSVVGMNTTTPPLQPGVEYAYRVRSVLGTEKSAWSVYETFSIIATSTATPLIPELSWPTDNATLYTNTPTLYWYVNGNSTGLTYELQCVPAADPWPADNIFVPVAGMNITTSPLQPGIQYAYRVRSVIGGVKSAWATYETFTIYSTPSAGAPPQPVLSWPIDDATSYTLTPTLYWYLNESSTGLTYELQCVPASEPWPADNVNVAVSQMSYTTPSLIGGTQYAWRVRSVSGTTPSSWSAYALFTTIAEEEPVMPIVGGPTNGTYINNANPMISWYLPTAPSGSQSYTLQISHNPDFSNATEITNINNLSCNASLSGSGTYYWRVKSQFENTTSSYFSMPGQFTVYGITDVKEEIIPVQFGLSQNYPNPFNPTTTISYDLPANSMVSITVFDVLGRELETIVNELQQAGNHKVNFNGSNLSSGVYYYKINAGEFVSVKKMILIK